MFFLPKNSLSVKTTNKKGRGIVTKLDIAAGTIIGDYLGIIIKPEDEERYEKGDELYLMYYHDRASVYPEKNQLGVHLLNHSCMPNCWIYTYKGHSLFFALRHIFAGEELTISYLISPIDKYCKPCTHICHCKTELCTGTMHLSDEKYEKWRIFDDALEKKTKRERIIYGKALKKLSLYPETISDNFIYDLFGNQNKIPEKFGETVLPDKKQLRQRIRYTGKVLSFPKIGIFVYGFYNDFTIIKPA